MLGDVLSKAAFAPKMDVTTITKGLIQFYVV
jgi:hypothetical protein